MHERLKSNQPFQLTLLLCCRSLMKSLRDGPAQDEPHWLEELSIMDASNVKAEIETANLWGGFGAFARVLAQDLISNMALLTDETVESMQQPTEYSDWHSILSIANKLSSSLLWHSYENCRSNKRQHCCQLYQILLRYWGYIPAAAQSLQSLQWRWEAWMHGRLQ